MLGLTTCDASHDLRLMLLDESYHSKVLSSFGEKKLCYCQICYSVLLVLSMFPACTMCIDHDATRCFVTVAIVTTWLCRESIPGLLHIGTVRI